MKASLILPIRFLTTLMKKYVTRFVVPDKKPYRICFSNQLQQLKHNKKQLKRMVKRKRKRTPQKKMPKRKEKKEAELQVVQTLVLTTLIRFIYPNGQSIRTPALYSHSNQHLLKCFLKDVIKIYLSRN